MDVFNPRRARIEFCLIRGLLLKRPATIGGCPQFNRIPTITAKKDRDQIRIARGLVLLDIL